MIILMSLLMFYLDVIILCCIFVFMLRMLLFNFWDVYLFGFPAQNCFMSWNYRVLAYEVGKNVVFKIHEVYYNEDGTPDASTVESCKMEIEDATDFRFMLIRMLECLDKPILWGDGRFPEEYKK
jgi:hypothetical protein